MTGADLLQIGSGLGAGIAGTLLAVLKYLDKKTPEGKPKANGYLREETFREGVKEICGAIEKAADGHTEDMQQLAGDVAKDVKILFLERRGVARD